MPYLNKRGIGDATSDYLTALQNASSSDAQVAADLAALQSAGSSGDVGTPALAAAPLSTAATAQTFSQWLTQNSTMVIVGGAGVLLLLLMTSGGRRR